MVDIQPWTNLNCRETNNRLFIGLPANSFFNISMFFINNIWTCTWDNTSEYNAGNYKITIWAIDEGRNINQSEEINIKLFGLTSLNLINLTEYNIIISLNGTIYEAYTGQNITIYANFVCLYPYSLIKGALGLLKFNGIFYYDNDLREILQDPEITTILKFALSCLQLMYYTRKHSNFKGSILDHLNFLKDKLFNEGNFKKLQ